MKNINLLQVLLLALAFCVTTSGLLAQITLKGQVTSSRGEPIKGATVTFYDEAGNQVDDCSTNSRGKFSCVDRTLSPDQSIEIEITADGFEVYKKIHQLKTGDFGSIILSRLLGIKGQIKSDAGLPLKDVAVTFYKDKTLENPLGNTITDEEGNYRSKKSFKRGQTIVVVAIKTGFLQSESEPLEIRGADDLELDFVLERWLSIAGFVRDSITLLPIQGVDVFFCNREDGRLIKAVKTNQIGYYEFDAPFTPGEVIRIQIRKDPEYVPIEKTLSIVNHEITPSRFDFNLPKWEDRVHKLGFRVCNKKRKKPLEGVEISYFGIEEKTVFTPANGIVILNMYQKPGTRVEFRFSKAGYRDLVYGVTLTIGDQNMVIYLENKGF